MRYLIDTCVVSDFVKGEPGTQERLKRTPSGDIAISTITVMEIHYGLVLNPQRTQKIKPTIDALLSAVTILPFTTREAKQSALVRSVLKAKGQPIGPYDVMIAATALEYQLVMVTANLREFERVAGLKTENWRA